MSQEITIGKVSAPSFRVYNIGTARIQLMKSPKSKRILGDLAPGEFLDVRGPVYAKSLGPGEGQIQTIQPPPWSV